jgi:hypothetical protein
MNDPNPDSLIQASMVLFAASIVLILLRHAFRRFVLKKIEVLSEPNDQPSEEEVAMTKTKPPKAPRTAPAKAEWESPVNDKYTAELHERNVRDITESRDLAIKQGDLELAEQLDKLLI